MAVFSNYRHGWHLALAIAVVLGLPVPTWGQGQPIQAVLGSPTSQPASHLKQPWPTQFTARAVQPRIQTQIEKIAVPVETEAMREERERRTFVAETTKLGSKLEEIKFDLERTPDRFTLQRLGSIVQQINFMFGNYEKKLTPAQHQLKGYLEAKRAVTAINQALHYWQQALQTQNMAQADAMATDDQTESVVQGYLKEAVRHIDSLSMDQKTQEAFKTSLKP
jgi:hypothetical protein